jgi:thiosulfate/3-mercaptopyruvate sulfurtransferase
LKYFGHDNVHILDGGIAEWKRSEYELTTDKPGKSEGNFKPHPRSDIIIDLEKLKNNTGELCIIDSRSPERYRGEVEPIDPVAGHIPGSINIDYVGNFDERGRYLSESILKRRFKDIDREPVIYCGSGVTACVNIVAMSISGRKVLLYPGGWSQWVSYPEHPVAKGD